MGWVRADGRGGGPTAEGARMLPTAAGTAKETEWRGRIAGALATAAKSCRHAAAGPHARGRAKAGLHGTGRKTAVRLAAACAAGAQALRTMAGPR